jgi:hypothetical protein
MKMDMDFFIGQNADERRRQEIEAAIKTVGEIVDRLSNMQVFYQTEFLEKLLPAIILDQISAWGYGDFYEDINKVVLATQKLAMERAQWEEGEDHPEGLGCRWSDPYYESYGTKD